MTPQRRRRVHIAIAVIFVVPVCIGVVAMAMQSRSTSSAGLLPPLHEEAAPQPAEHHSPAPREYVESDYGVSTPGEATLAGPPASVVRRFARDWANRNTVLTPATREEMVGLSAGAWAGAVFRQARLTLPAIEGVGAEGDLVMMKLTTVSPQSKTALAVTQERLVDANGTLTPPRYELYLARLDRVTPRGYAITAWEPQQ
jgi:hypothetical protein